MARADIWMPLYIGDYLGDTMHLTTEQHGAYFLLMMAYWKNGGALQGGDVGLSAICRMSMDAWSIARVVLVQFFDVDPVSGAWRHERIEKEMAEAGINKEKRAIKAKAAAEARWKKDAPSIAKSTPQEMLEQCPSPSPSPINISPNGECKQDESQEPAKRVPYDEILIAFRSKLPGLPQPRKMEDDRKRAVRTIWNKDERYQSAEFFERYFDYVSRSEFLMNWNGLGFDWLFQPKNFRKVIEGNYENKGKGNA